jgi:hypothetical protein
MLILNAHTQIQIQRPVMRLRLDFFKIALQRVISRFPCGAVSILSSCCLAVQLGSEQGSVFTLWLARWKITGLVIEGLVRTGLPLHERVWCTVSQFQQVNKLPNQIYIQINFQINVRGFC